MTVTRTARLPRLADLRPPVQSITADVRVEGALLAVNARPADRLTACALCERAIVPGRDRVCDLPDGRTVHTGCAARAS